MKTDTFANEIQRRYSGLNPTVLTLQELREVTLNSLKETTLSLHNELEELMVQKEQIERSIARKSDELQQLKYRFFDVLEKMFSEDDAMLEKLHQIKIQSVDLLDILEEMVESAIITTLERGSDIEETLHEILKEITFETLNANVLNAIRIRRILASILQTALNLAEATPNQADTILRGTLLGIRSASISRSRNSINTSSMSLKRLKHSIGMSTKPSKMNSITLILSLLRLSTLSAIVMHPPSLPN